MVSIEKRVHTLYKFVISDFRGTDFRTAFSMIGGLRAKTLVFATTKHNVCRVYGILSKHAVNSMLECFMHPWLHPPRLPV